MHVLLLGSVLAAVAQAAAADASPPSSGRAPALPADGDRQRDAIDAILALPSNASSPEQHGIFAPQKYREKRVVYASITLSLLAAVLLMLLLFFYQRLCSQRYSNAQRKAARIQDADKCIIKILRSCSIQAVSDYHFRGIRRKNQKVSIRFENLSTTIVGKPDPLQCFKRSADKTILTSVSGEFVAGRMSAIMGPSGAGKTTFLNVLCGKTKAQGEWDVTGTVLINGEEMDISKLKPVTGFVPQEDVVHEGMTVRENIRFSAELRNAAGTSYRRLERITGDTLQVLQLGPQANILVGNRTTGGGLSGGQRKRVNVGVELAACPSLLFLDEPTSGLDSTSSLMLVEMLKKMTTLGMTVVMVIHQPRYVLFTLIDEVLLLGRGGRTVYMGPTQGAKDYFEYLGFTMPVNENPADWMMDVTSGQVEIPNPKISSDELPERLFLEWERHPHPISPCRSGASEGRRTLDFRTDREMIQQNVRDMWNKVAPHGSPMNVEELTALLELSSGHVPDPDIAWELMRRITKSEKKDVETLSSLFVVQAQFIEYLSSFREADTLGRLSPDDDDDDMDSILADSDDAPDDTADSGSDSGVDERRVFREECEHHNDLQRRVPGFWRHLKVVVHRRALQWSRRGTLRTLFFIVVLLSAGFLGFMDRFIFQTPAWMPTTFLNAHISVALLTSVYCQQCFSDDRPVYWREASHGLNRFAFLIGRQLVDTIDVLLMSLFFTTTYYVITGPALYFGVYVCPFLLIAFVASSWGYAIGTVLPPALGPFVCAVLMFMMGGMLGLPDKMGIFLDGGLLETVVSLVCFTRWSVPMNFLAYKNRTPPNVTAMSEVVRFQYDMFSENYQRSHWALPAEASAWWTGILALICMGFVLRFLAYLGLRFVNAGKQV